MAKPEPVQAEPRDLALWLGSARSACRLQTLLPVWLWLSASYWVHRLLEAPWSTVLGGILLASGALLLGGWVALHTAQEIVLMESPSIRSLWSKMRQSLGTLFLAPLATIATSLLFFLLALSGGTLGWVPWVGDGLFVLWMLSAGLLFSSIAAAWTLVGLGALPLQIAASTLERSSAFEIVGRSFSYVRHQPLFLLGAWLTVLASSLLGSAVFLVGLFLGIFGLEGALAVKEGRFPEPVTLGKAVAALWAHPQAWWLPMAKPLYEVSPASGWAVHAARLLPSFFLASLFSGMARVYFSVRRREDGVPVRSPAP